MKRLIIALIVLIVTCPNSAFAQTDTVFATYTYTMGDNDTKSDARQLCFLYAKRQCLEKAGTFVQSELKVRKQEQIGSAGGSYNELTQQDVSTYTAAFVKVDIVSEETSFSDKTLEITMKVQAIVDINALLDQITEIRNNRELEQKVRDQQMQLAKMDSSIRELQGRLTTNSPDLVSEARIQRKEMLEAMSEIEKIHNEISTKSKLAVENILPGMTAAEVVKIVGKPRSQQEYQGEARYNYGNVWVVFEYGLVSFLVRVPDFRNNATKKDYTSEEMIIPSGATKHEVEDSIQRAIELVRQAEEAGAANVSPRLFEKAKDFLAEAQRLFEQGLFDDAQKKAEFAIMRAEQAKHNAKILGGKSMPHKGDQ